MRGLLGIPNEGMIVSSLNTQRNGWSCAKNETESTFTKNMARTHTNSRREQEKLFNVGLGSCFIDSTPRALEGKQKKYDDIRLENQMHHKGNSREWNGSQQNGRLCLKTIYLQGINSQNSSNSVAQKSNDTIGKGPK